MKKFLTSVAVFFFAVAFVMSSSAELDKRRFGFLPQTKELFLSDNFEVTKENAYAIATTIIDEGIEFYKEEEGNNSLSRFLGANIEWLDGSSSIFRVVLIDSNEGMKTVIVDSYPPPEPNGFTHGGYVLFVCEEKGLEFKLIGEQGPVYRDVRRDTTEDAFPKEDGYKNISEYEFDANEKELIIAYMRSMLNKYFFEPFGEGD